MGFSYIELCDQMNPNHIYLNRVYHFEESLCNLLYDNS
jgi:hypothetical protein